MKYRIMEDSNGKYVQYKRFGIWCNLFMNINKTSIGKQYYDITIEEIIEIVTKNNTTKNILLKEFEV
jgi:hypothetical protein